MKPIIFYNNFHNGDIHVSRAFVMDIIKKVNTTFEYYHNCSPKLLQDIDVVHKQTNENNYNFSNVPIIYETENEILINTWYNVNQPAFGKNGGCTLKTLYENFRVVYQHLNIPLEDIEYYIPTYDFSKYDIGPVIDFMFENRQNKIYISNGYGISGQCDNFDFDTIVDKLSDVFPNYLFILSNNTKIQRDNVINSNTITQTLENDLVENAYIMTHCDIIIGRCNGSFTTGLIKENLIGEKKQTWCGICKINPKFGVEELLHPNKSFYSLSYKNVDQIYEQLETIILNFYNTEK